MITGAIVHFAYYGAHSLSAVWLTVWHHPPPPLYFAVAWLYCQLIVAQKFIRLDEISVFTKHRGTVNCSPNIVRALFRALDSRHSVKFAAAVSLAHL